MRVCHKKRSGEWYSELTFDIYIHMDICILHTYVHTLVYIHTYTQKKKDEEFSWQSHHFPMDMRHCREWSLRKLAVAKRSLGKDVAQGGALGGGIKGYL